MADGKKEYTITWFIENYSYCWHKSGDELVSPEFIADGLEGTVWFLGLFPRGFSDDEEGYISFVLCRAEMDEGPEKFPLEFELSFLSADGSVLCCERNKYEFVKCGSFDCFKFLPLDILFREKDDYLPQDTLSVCFRMWKGEGKIRQKTQIYARTRIGIKKLSFLHVTENFSTFDHNEKKIIQIKWPAITKRALSSSVYITDGSCSDGEVTMEITPRKDQILSIFRISLMDASDKVVLHCEADNRQDVKRRNIQKLSLPLTSQAILSKKEKYLPGDKLSLRCECTLSTGLEFQKIERIVLESPLVASNLPIKNAENKHKYGSLELLSPCSSALDDFADLYNNRLLTDMELKTKTKSFPAHKNVLCARSSVFKALLTNDMREKHTNCIQIDDLEDDTVQQFLLFLYSDQLEKIEWKSAIKLYYAGDKYAVQKLKVICASFLVKHMSTSNAIELLLLADTYNDWDLKNTVEDLIFDHEEEIFVSKQWRNLIKTNPTLVSETMCRMYV